MNAVIRNKCEAEALAAFQYIAAELGIEVLLETTAHTEGGLKEVWAFVTKTENFLAANFLILLIATFWNYVPPPDKEMEALNKEVAKATIEEKKLSIEKLKQEIAKGTPPPAVAEKAVPLFQCDLKIVTRRSNFYKILLPYDKVTAVGMGIIPEGKLVPDVEHVVPRGDFQQFVLTDDKLPTEVDNQAIIEIVAPVITDGNLHWKGTYLGDTISFSMKDPVFKGMVMRREVSFQHGNSISCVLNIERKVDAVGEVVIRGYSVQVVLAKIDGSNTIETPQGKRQRFYDKHRDDQITLFDFNEITR